MTENANADRQQRYAELAVEILDLNVLRASDRMLADDVAGRFMALADEEIADKGDEVRAFWLRETAKAHRGRKSAETALTRVRELAKRWEAAETWEGLPAIVDRTYGRTLRAALDPASPATRPSPAPADDEGTGTGAAPSEGHSEAQAQVARAAALIDRWDGEIGAQEDRQHPAAVRAVEACLSDLRDALALHDHAGCCTCCGGAGYDNHCAGMCWDCRGTGHPHPLEDD